MKSEWQIIVDGANSADEQMAADERLAQRAQLTARFFEWQPAAISLGWKQPRPEWLEPDAWRGDKLEWVERPTGGGIAFHGSDVSVAVVVLRAKGVSLALLMRAVCQSAVRLCTSYGIDASALLEAPSHGRIAYCLTQHSPYAVLVDGRKVAGFALRRYPASWLIQGSLLINPLPEILQRMLPVSVGEAIQRRAVSLSVASGASLDEADVMRRWAAHWTSWWPHHLPTSTDGGRPVKQESTMMLARRHPTSYRSAEPTILLTCRPREVVG
ncbi:MAG: hypothetical protein HY352_00670 [Candidatus Omnitrophica bacterium]|nr:hypothetical protein [Candidatus Omnitrophota bacterium]